MTIRIYFHKFWDGFIEGTDSHKPSFFIELFTRVFNENVVMEQNIDNANVLCENAWCSVGDSLLYKKSWRATFLFTGESTINLGIISEERRQHWQRFTCFLSGLATNKMARQVQCPLLVSYLFCNPQLCTSAVDSIPHQNACAVISNPCGDVRNHFLDKLEARMHVTYGGHFRLNIGQKVSGNHNSNDLIQFIRQFKFVIAMENSEEEYYLTEKICNGLFAGVIPIYWGCPNVSQYVHHERFLHLKNGSDEECERIIQKILTMDNETYMKMVRAPAFTTDVHSMINKIVQEIKYIME